DAAVLEYVSDFPFTQKEVNWHHGLASQQRPVETGDKSGAGGKEQAHPRRLGLKRNVHPQPGNHAGKLLPGVLSPVVNDGKVLRMALGMSENRFEEHLKLSL